MGFCHRQHCISHSDGVGTFRLKICTIGKEVVWHVVYRRNPLQLVHENIVTQQLPKLPYDAKLIMMDGKLTCLFRFPSRACMQLKMRVVVKTCKTSSLFRHLCCKLYLGWRLLYYNMRSGWVRLNLSQNLF
jgi:hypothetical protein